MLEREMIHAEEEFDRGFDSAGDRPYAQAFSEYRAAWLRYVFSEPANLTEAAARIERAIVEGCDLGDERPLGPIRHILVKIHRDMSRRKPVADLAKRVRWAADAADIIAGNSDYAHILRSVARFVTRPQLVYG